ncbi:MAG TPA: phosphoenolpyruvate synthase [Nitrososphaerales archaeon]|nr:phosphoenolpyruvate synthase [Nitrososphaerales archaeon]
MDSGFIKFLDEIGKRDTSFAGGKGANLGEMFRSHLPVPPAFVVTTKAYETFLAANALDPKVEKMLSTFDYDDIARLDRDAAEIRKLIESSKIPAALVQEIARAYLELRRRCGGGRMPVAVRSSATMEDLRDASFAGQQITLLNVKGMPELLKSIKRCWGSVYTARAAFYRAKKGFGFKAIPTAVVVQKQVMSERAGVGFTVHPMTGDRSQMVIESSYGQGEEIVSGGLTPDTFVIDKKTGKVVEQRISHKWRMKVARGKGSGLEDAPVPEKLRDRPSLSRSEIEELRVLALALEGHYHYPQDFEWTIEKGRIFLVQTRAVTVLTKEAKKQERVEVTPLLKGLGASPGMGTGRVKLVLDIKDLGRVEKGDVLVTKMTTPDYVPAMLKTAGIVTNEGGMTSHAAIVSRELGVPCIVGTGTATQVLKEGSLISVDGSRGIVFSGEVASTVSSKELTEELREARKLKTKTKIYMNLGVPEKIKDYANIPFDGIGLMRVEFIIASHIGEHPLRLMETNRSSVFVDLLAEGIATVAKQIDPKPLVVRFSDFKSNEYRALEGGEKYEDVEANPMIGWRGVSRYVSPEYQKAFELEVKAIKKVRETLGLKNVWVMLPFVRTTWEVTKCVEMIEKAGLKRGPSFKVWLMAEVPSIVFMGREFAELCDGFSIGSNDLTQLVLGIDRDSAKLAGLGYFDERDEAVKRAIRMLIEAAHSKGKTISICGQAPSVYPEFAEYLVGLGIDSISVNPDTVARTRILVSGVESRMRKAR